MRFPFSAVLALVLSVPLAAPLLAQEPVDPLTPIEADQIPGDFAAAMAEAAQARAQFLAGDHAAALEALRPMADAGNPVAQNLVGIALTELNAAYGPYDRDAGFAYLRAAAEQDFGPAMHNLADTFEEDHGDLAPNPEEAFRWYLAAAELGYPYAFYDAGHALVNGNGVVADVAAGRAWIERALDGPERMHALEMLGDLAYYGEGQDEDLAQALDYYLQSAEAGSAQAAFNAAYQYYWGEGTSLDDAAAIPLLELAVAGDVLEAYGYLALLLRQDAGDHPADPVRARAVAMVGDDLGNGFASAVLGDFHRMGVGGEVDFALARAAYLRGQERGDVDAVYQLGDMAYFGRGEAVDYARALEFYHAALEILPEHGDSLYSIAYMQMRGEGTEVDIASATEFLERSIAHRHWYSMLEAVELFGAPAFAGPQTDAVRARAHCLYLVANGWQPGDAEQASDHAATCARLEAELSAEDQASAAAMAEAF